LPTEENSVIGASLIIVKHHSNLSLK